VWRRQHRRIFAAALGVGIASAAIGHHMQIVAESRPLAINGSYDAVMGEIGPADREPSP